MFPVFHLGWSTWPPTKTFVAGWRKVLRRVERWSTLSNKFWLCYSFFVELTTCHATNAAIWDPHQANQRIGALHFFNPQQILLLCDRLITQGEKRETSTQNLHETMLRDKLRVLYLVFRHLNASSAVKTAIVIFLPRSALSQSTFRELIRPTKYHLTTGS